MLAHRPVGADDIVMPEHAIRNLLADLEADEPYIVTHGAIRADYTERHDALVAAIDRMETVMTDPDLQRLLDIEAIKQLKARYFRFLDTKQWDDWGMVFTEDVVMEVPEADMVNNGRAEVVGNVSAALAGTTTTHHGHMPEIDITGPDTAGASGRCSTTSSGPPPTAPGSASRATATTTRSTGATETRWRIAKTRLERLRVDPLT